MPPIISIVNVEKSYASGVQALKTTNLSIDKGEIFALLGPNGAGKTTLISIICGIVTATAGTVTADGHDIVREYRAARTKIGLVPQELTTDSFETVWATVTFSRGLFGRAPNPSYVEEILRDLSLWEKRDAKIMELSGGMKRRVMIAKALSHEPEILFLDEPTAGVDVELRRDMWGLVRRLRDRGVTIILTTHYIEEAEEMADRIGVINQGSLVLVEEKKELMKKLGKRQLTLHLHEPLTSIPAELEPWSLELKGGGSDLVYTVDGNASMDISTLARAHEQIVDLDQGPADPSKFARGHFRQSRQYPPMNHSAARIPFNRHGVWAIYKFEIARALRTLVQSLVTPVITTSLVFRRLRRGDRIAHECRLWRELRRLHRARTHDAGAAHRKPAERLVRHLLPEIHRHDL